jgi:phage/plasmid-like protein (TIGR03299 family)
MAHELEIVGKKAKMAYADGDGRMVPWHRLGTPMAGLQTMEAMLEAAEADYDVILTRVAAVDDNGDLVRNNDGSVVIVEDSRATVRQNLDGSFNALATVGTRYEVRQNREVLERAFAVIGASEGDAVMDTLGVLRNGARFFATIELGGLIIDPAGVNDKIARYLVVSAGHDGVWPIRYANTDIRAVCSNTVVLGLKNAQRVFTARHTRNVDGTIEDAREVLNISVKWAESFGAEAERMLSINAPLGGKKIDSVIEAVFPKDKSETERQKNNREQTYDLIRNIYLNNRNAGKFGFNGWSLYNAIVEYIDFYRISDPVAGAVAAMDENSSSTQKKILAHRAVVS